MLKNANTMKWKRVEVDDPNLTSKGLVAIEECLDYNLANEESDRKTVKRKNGDERKAKKKRSKLSSSSVENAPSLLTPSKSGSSFETDVEDAEKAGDSDVWCNFGLAEPIIKALIAQGFQQPTPIQSLTLPAAILGHKDIVGAAQTGSGKTLAFGLPILNGILSEKDSAEDLKRPLYALILTPTRELALQVRDHLVAAATFTGINVAAIVGGMAAVKQERILSKGPEIVVATPGRLWELIQEGNEHLSQIDSIRYLVIDETDKMLEKGHFEELHNLLERVNFDKDKSQKRQNFVFSATLTLVHELPKYLVKKSKTSKMTPHQKLQKVINILGIKNPKIVDITPESAVPETLTECRISCAFEEKDYYIYYFLQKHPGRTIIFCNSIGCVKRLSNLLSILGCQPLPLHASMQQRQRLRNLERFKEQEHGILIATDVAARGLDIPKIEHVLHYQTPRTSESYIHRSGRTARASQHGITVVLMEPNELHSYIKLRKTLNKSEDLPTFPIQAEYLNAVKQIVNLAREVDKLELEIRKENSEEGWLQKAAKEMDIIVDDYIKKYDGVDTSQKKLAQVKRKQLASLLAKPIFPQGFSGKYPFHLRDSLSNHSISALEMVQTQKKNKFKKRKISHLRNKSSVTE